jgi:fimbrial isopeptide formation D2 family protein/LPXTG-motif cell wall-anchored protein
MERLKRVMAFIISMVMMVSTMGTTTAFAAEGAPTDTSISVTGLDSGDKVNFYQVLKYDETSIVTGGWVAAEGFTTLTTAQIQKMLGLGTDGKPATDKTEHPENYGIDATLAGTISKMAQAEGVSAKFANVAAAQVGQTTDYAATAATTTIGTAGLYVALVTPGTTDELYNPVFVAADYTVNGSNTQEAVTSLSYSPEALAKKEGVTLTKEIDGTTDTKYDINIGDKVNFTITSKVPAYSTAYQNPIYEITDTMEDGLALKALPTVTIQDVDLVADDYTITPSEIGSTDVRSFTVKLKQTALAKVTAKGSAKTIEVKYTAIVKSLENATVTEKENEATVKFSNNPDDSTSYNLLEDKTRNYTFTIDGNLLGYKGTSYETDELIKTGLKADGKPATTTKKYHSAEQFTELSPLAGAKFALFKEEPVEADYTSVDAAIASTKIYNNSEETDGIIESDANGRLKITGLDAGDYWLHEVSAPTGYIADNRTFHITITAVYEQIEGGTYTNKDGILVKYGAYKILKSYTVKVNDGTGDTTSTYNIVNKGESDHKVVDRATYTQLTGENADWAGDNVTPISNTQGTELPSTGGIGTTVFYIVGGVMVAGAVIFLLTKRRIAGNE